MEEILQINNLTKKFSKITAVDNLSFSVKPGNVYGLLGPNGSGKTTTLSIILNLCPPTSGTWKWFNKNTNTDSLKKIGAILESPSFYGYLSAEHNLKIVAKIKNVPNNLINDEIDKKLNLVGLLERKNDLFKKFSLGMKQRLSIAAALLNNPRVLILDEPTNGLDPDGIVKVRDIISKIASSGTTIILASHMLSEIEKVCSHVIVLKQGRALYSGPIDEMISSNGYFELYAKQNKKLLETLKTIKYFKKIVKRKDDLIIAILNKDLDAETLNNMLFDHGIILQHLVKKKESLEEQFFQLTKNNQ